MQSSLRLFSHSQQGYVCLFCQQAQHNKAVADLNALLVKRETEVNRLRGERDQAQAELNERKRKDIQQLNSANEWQTLAEARKVRALCSIV